MTAAAHQGTAVPGSPGSRPHLPQLGHSSPSTAPQTRVFAPKSCEPQAFPSVYPCGNAGISMPRETRLAIPPALYFSGFSCYTLWSRKTLPRGVIGSTTGSGSVSWGSSPYGVIFRFRIADFRRGDRAAECAGLENRCTGNGTEGSNPSLSAPKTLVFPRFFAFLATCFGFPARPCLHMLRRLVRCLDTW